jgi:TonB family protein
VSNGDADAVRALLAEGTHVDQRARGGQTALMLAAFFGHVEIARLLLAAGADVRLQDNLGLTAREWADRRGSSEVARLLSNASPEEIVPSPKKSPAKQAQAKVEAEPRNPAAEVKTSPHLDALSGTEEQLRTKADQQHREVEESPREAEPQRRASATEIKIAPQDDSRRWIQGQLRIIADLERRKAEETRRAPATETNIGSQRSAPSGTEEQQKTNVESQRREAEQARRVSPIETKIAPQQNAPSLADEQETTKPEAQRREVEEARRASPIETKVAPQQNAPSVADEQQTTKPEPQRSEAEEARPTATQSARIAARTEHSRILEESRRRVEAEVRARSQSETRAAVERGHLGLPSGAAYDPQPSISAGVPSPVGFHVDRNDSDTRQEGLPAEASTRPAMLEPKPSEALNYPPIQRCPKCKTTYKSDLLAYCSYDATRLISADDPLFNSPAIHPLFNSPAANDWAQPTVWVLVTIMVAGGASIGYLINSYLWRENGSRAPIAAQIEQPENARKDSPKIDGALSGMEVNVPEPDYPVKAKTEGVSGTVTVRVQVNKKGRVISARSSSGDWRLRAAAVEAAQKATFSAEKLAGRGAIGTITYVFRL